jgi:hypothetical protein
MKFKVEIELKHVSGPEQDEETMIDCLAGTIGHQNGATVKALKLVVADADGGPEFGGGPESVYQVWLVDA